MRHMIAYRYHFFLTLAAMWLLALAGMAQDAYNRTIHGIVTDENNEPLPAAYVKEVTETQGTSISGVITDINGHFSLTLPKSTQESKCHSSATKPNASVYQPPTIIPFIFNRPPNYWMKSS